MKSSEKDSLTLKTSDKKHFQVLAKFMELCPGLKPLKGSEVFIPCDSETAEAVIKYLKSHDYNPESYLKTPLHHSRIESYLHDEDLKWIKKVVSQERLVPMLELALHLQLQPLVDLCAAVAASTIREVTLKDIERKYEPENQEAFSQLQEELENKYYKGLNIN